MKITNLKQLVTLLVTAGVLIGCSPQAPAAPTPLPAATKAAPTQPLTAPDTPTAAPLEATAPPETPIAETPTSDPGSNVGGSATPPTLPDTGMAVVENLDVRILESFPVQVQAVVTGYLPDGCTTITAVEAVNEGMTFRIHITTDRPADAMCTMQIVNFEQVVALATAELPAGTYQVVVNDLAVNFDLPEGNAAAQPLPEAGAYPFVETPTAFVMANVDVPIYDAPLTDGNEIGLIAGGQMARVTGASQDGAWWRVICPDDTVGDCWVSAAPDLTAPASPSN